MPSPRVGTAADIAELVSVYAQPPDGVRVNMIFSADGAAAFGGRAGPLSCPADQQLLRMLRGFADVVLVGAGTARAENYGPVQLTDAQRARRHREGRTSPPPIAVISRTGEVPAALFSDPDQPPILLTCARGAARRGEDRDHRRDRWRRVLVAGEDAVDAARAVALLQAEGMHRILCEGGPTLLDALVDTDLVVEICVTVAPKLASSQPVGHRVRPSLLAAPRSMRLEHALVLDDYLFLRYRR